MDARKYAWQILHAEIRRRVGDDANDQSGHLHPELANIGLLLKQAREEDVSELEIIIELAGFGATYALMPPDASDPLSAAQEIELHVMAESDGTEDWKDGMRWFKRWAEEHPLLDDEDEDGNGG